MSNLLRQLVVITAVFCIVFGLWMLPVALFVGPHMLVATAVYIGIGLAFACSAYGLTRARSWAPWLALASSSFVVIASVEAIRQILGTEDSDGLIFWVPAGLYFTALVAIALLVIRARPTRDTLNQRIADQIS